MVDDVRAGKMPRRRFVKVLSAMGISAAGASAIAAAASHASSSKPAAPVQPGEQPDTHIQLHQQHIAHQSQGNKHALQEAERESPGHYMPGMNRRSFKGGEGNAATESA